jgi:hypothetical protein
MNETLYRLNEVPDPDGSLQDALADLLDNSALVEVSVDEAMIQRATMAAFENTTVRGSITEMRRAMAQGVLAALEVTR